MLRNVEVLKKYLSTNSLKQTAERIDIANAVTLLDNIFTVDELMDKINENSWPVSKATLYRSIPLLIESGMIKPIATHKLNNHIFKRCDEDELIQTFECDKCNQSISLEYEIINDINQKLANKYDFNQIVDNLLMLKGICPCCVDKSQSGSRKNDNENLPVRIILLEDHELYKSVMVDYFKIEGYEVFAFQNPSDFNLECSCNSNQNVICADILIVDIKMPVMKGVEFIKKQIAKNCRIKNIAFISGHWTLEDLDFAGAVGAAIFHKPFNISDLNSWVKQCIPSLQKERILGSEFIK